IEDDDEWLHAAYDLMTNEFQADVLDPCARYVEWLDLNRKGTHSFPLLMIAAYFPLGEKAITAGVISGNIMKIQDYAGLEGERSPYIYAIGHQVTSEILRSKGFKGLGRNLMSIGISEARKMVE